MIGKDGSEWIEIDLQTVHTITATESMGRFGNGQGAEFAENYMYKLRFDVKSNLQSVNQKKSSPIVWLDGGIGAPLPYPILPTAGSILSLKGAMN